MNDGGIVPTLAGKVMNLREPDSAQVCVEDIALSLSKQCRFNGHIQGHYSVAEHCVVMSWLVPRKVAIYALLHDAAEAYMGDIVGPVKVILPGIAAIENKILDVIYPGLEVEPPDDETKRIVEKADRQMLNTEWQQLVRLPMEPWLDDDVETFEVELATWPWQDAKRQWLTQFHTLIAVMEGESR